MSLRRWRVLPLLLGVLGLLACAGMLLIVSYRHNVRVDLTPQRSYTLSDHAQKILAALDRDVEITVFVRRGDPRTPIVKDLLWRIRTATPRVSYEFVDLNRSPVRARQYGVDRYGAVVVESGGRRRDISNPSEGLLMGAILGVTRARDHVVYFVTGHGERSPENADRQEGYSTAKRALQDELFSVREVALIGPAGAVPPDASVVVIAGPRKDYLPEEIRRLDAYLAAGGNLLALLDPQSPRTVAGIVQRYGVAPRDSVVVDPEHRLAAGEGVTIVVPGLDPSFLVSRSLEAPPVFAQACSLEIGAEAEDSTIAFLKTGAASHEVAPSGSEHRAESAHRGPLVVGVAIVPAAGRGRDQARAGRGIVFGDADFASNAVIDYLGNKDLLVNSVNWLVRDDSLIAARTQGKERGREQFFVTQEQQRLAFWLATVVQPSAFLIAGLVVFIRGRLR